MLKKEATQAKPKDARIYAVIPIRAYRDDRLSKTDWRVLTGAAGLLRKNSEIVRVPQEYLGTGIGLHHAQVSRSLARLIHYGYMVRLKAGSRDGKVAALYGIIFDQDHPPSKDHAEPSYKDVQDIEEMTEQLLKKEAHVQPVCTNTSLQVAWNKLAGGQYISNEREAALFIELSRIGCTPADLASVFSPGKPLIGYHMGTLRSMLAGG